MKTLTLATAAVLSALVLATPARAQIETKTQTDTASRAATGTRANVTKVRGKLAAGQTAARAIVTANLEANLSCIVTEADETRQVFLNIVVRQRPATTVAAVKTSGGLTWRPSTGTWTLQLDAEDGLFALPLFIPAITVSLGRRADGSYREEIRVGNGIALLSLDDDFPCKLGFIAVSRG